jgi:hypothetical protein
MAEKSRSSMLQEAEPVSEPLSGQLFAEMRARQEGDLQYLMVTWAVQKESRRIRGFGWLLGDRIVGFGAVLGVRINNGPPKMDGILMIQH